MSKVLKIEDGNYTVKVEAGQEIIFDTKRDTASIGTVRVVGNLVVSGITTSVETVDTVITDNIITINDGENGDGITPSGRTAGIEISRGSRGLASVLFDENISWEFGGTNGDGVFTFNSINGVGNRAPITTSGIVGQGNLYVLCDVITVQGTSNYEENVLNYVNGSLQFDPQTNSVVLDNDHIPNIKAVVDYVDFVQQTVGASLISSGDTIVRTTDSQYTASASTIEFTVDGSLKAILYNDRLELEAIKVAGTEISTIVSNADLTLSAPGVGAVVVNDTLHILDTPGIDDVNLDPAIPNNGFKLYSKNSGLGNTGIYFANKENYRSELIDHKKALVYSMIF